MCIQEQAKGRIWRKGDWFIWCKKDEEMEWREEGMFYEGWVINLGG